jgi:hypothetical protein
VVGEAFYEPLDDPAPGATRSAGRYRATAHTAGPWDPALQHGGPPAALLARAVERLAAGPPRPLLTRLSAEILAPVPVTDLVVRARVVRAGRRVAWCTADLATAAEPDSPLVHLHAWVMRREDDLALPHTPADPAPPPGTLSPRPDGWNPGYLDAVEWRTVAGELAQPGPATVWTRLRVDLVRGEAPSGVQRVCAVADSGSGISAVDAPARLVFVNTDLTIHLVREPDGPAVWMDSTTTIDRAGIGLASTTLGDERGALGTAAQALFVTPR